MLPTGRNHDALAGEVRGDARDVLGHDPVAVAPVIPEHAAIFRCFGVSPELGEAHAKDLDKRMLGADHSVIGI